MSMYEKYERCANLCADYKEKFNKYVPMYLMCFYDFDYISEKVEKAIKDNKELEEE